MKRIVGRDSGMREAKMSCRKSTKTSTLKPTPSLRAARQGGVGRQRWLITLFFSTTLWPLLTSPAAAQFARLYSIENGDVYLRRPNWSDFYRTQPRTMLTGDDALIVEGDASTRVTLLCPNGSQQLWTTGVGQAANVGSTCFGTPRWFRPSFGVSNTWHATDATEPYVISPWAGQVLTTTPHLRWNAVEGASGYSVGLLHKDSEGWTEMWTVNTTHSSINYPRDEAALELGEEYALQVTVTGEPKGAEESSVIFGAISGPPRRAAEAESAEIDALPIDRAMKVVRLVEEVYPTSDLYAEGINDLTALINDGMETAQIQRLLGDYFVRSGLVIPAEESYLAALSLAEMEENIEEEATAAWGIGTVYGRVGREEEARVYLEQGLAIAKELGDEDLAASIEKELDRLTTAQEL